MKKTISALFALCVLALFACSKSNTVSSDNVAMKSSSVADQVLVMRNLEPEYLDPALIAETAGSRVAINTYEGLLNFHPQTLQPIPGVAKDWKVNKDNTVFTFYLRKNAKWSNGDPVTAHDFVYSWQRVANPATAARYAYMTYYIKNAKLINENKIKDLSKLGMKALDDHTLEIYLENPTLFFPSIAAWYTLYPVHKTTVEKHDRRWTRPENFVGNGPFVIDEWIPGKQISLKPNEHYWDRKEVKLAKVVYPVLEDLETALKKMQAGEIHFIDEVPAIKIPSLRGTPGFVETSRLGSYYLEVRVDKTPMNNKFLRQALAHAIDRKQLVEVINKGIAHTGYTPKGIAGYVPPNGPSFNPEKAKQLLKQAGYANGSEVPHITLIYNTSENHKTVMEIIQSMWKQHLGIDAALLNMEWKVVLKTRKAGDFQVSRAGWIGDYMDPNTFMDLHTSYSGNNHSGWANPEYDKLIEMAAREVDQKKRYEYFYKAEQLMLDELPVIPIYTYTFAGMIDSKLAGFYPNFKDLHPLKGVYFKK